MVCICSKEWGRLIEDGLFGQLAVGVLKITGKGRKMYDFFYSKPLLEDVKDSFSLFFEKNYKSGSLMNRKRITLKMLESTSSDYAHVYTAAYKRGVLMTTNKHTCNGGNPR